MSETKPHAPPAMIALRDPMEILYAHDTLVAVVRGDLDRIEVDPETKLHLTLALDVLCWALKHDHNQSFNENLERLRALIREAGYRVNGPLPAPVTTEELRRRPN